MICAFGYFSLDDWVLGFSRGGPLSGSIGSQDQVVTQTANLSLGQGETIRLGFKGKDVSQSPLVERDDFQNLIIEASEGINYYTKLWKELG
jgi:hypothetical protein